MLNTNCFALHYAGIKHIRLITTVATIILLSFFSPSAKAEDDEGPDIDNAMEIIDFEDADRYISDMNLSEDISLKEIIKQVIESGYSMDVIVQQLNIRENIKNLRTTFISLTCTLIFIMLACNLVNSISVSGNNIVEFISIIFVILISLPAIRDCANAATLIYNEISRFSSVMMPLLCTILTIMGGIGSAGLTSALVLLVDTTLMEIIINIIMPLITIAVAIALVSPLSSRTYLASISSLISSVIKWALGICVTIITTVFSIRAASLAAADGIMLKTAEYAIGDLVPVVGRSISKITGVMMGGIVMVKNAFGSISIIILISRCLYPIAIILLYLFAYKIASSIALLFDNKKIHQLCTSISTGITLYLVVAVSVVVIIIVIIITSVSAANRIMTYI